MSRMDTAVDKFVRDKQRSIRTASRDLGGILGRAGIGPVPEDTAREIVAVLQRLYGEATEDYAAGLRGAGARI